MDAFIATIIMFIVSLVLLLESIKMLNGWEGRIGKWKSPVSKEEYAESLAMGWLSAMGSVIFGGCTVVSIILIIFQIIFIL